ncbi:MAG: SOS response-associated peptidase [Pseudomonadota bacterium]
MSGRYATALIAGHADTVDWLGIERAPPPDWIDDWDGPPLIEEPSGAWTRPSWNIAPTQMVTIVVQRRSGGPRKVGPARWGFVPRWWDKPLAAFKLTTFNARSEEAAQKPMFRDAWASARCLIPAAGYYEWQREGSAKTPYFITADTNRPGFCFGGLWSVLQLGGERLVSCTILTTAAGDATRHLHPRSPVVLHEDCWADWFAGRYVAMTPIPDERIRLHAVDSAVGNVRNDDAALTQPADPAL